MAYIPSECSIQEYENQIYSGESLHRLYVKHGNTIIGANGDNNASPFASKLTWKRRILANGSNTFSLDNFVAQEIDLVLHDYQITNLDEELEIKIGTFIESVNDFVYIPLGIYKIQDNPTTDKDKTTYKLRDRSVNFDFNYNAKELIDNSEKVDETDNKYVTKLEILQDICRKANVEYIGTTTFKGYDDKVAIYDNTITARKYISYIFEQAGMFVFINRLGQLESKSLNNLTTKTIDYNLLEKFTKGEKYKISKIVYETGNIKWENGTDENDNLYINSANPYITKQEDIDRLNDVIGFSIDSFSTGKVLGNPTIDPYDLIEITYNDIIYTTLAQYTLTFVGVMTCNYDTTIKYEAKQSNVSLNSQATFKKTIKTEIDNVNGTLTSTAEDVNELTGALSRVETTLSSQAFEIEVLTTKTSKIDEDGNATSLQTSNGYKFDSEGLHMSNSEDDYNASYTNQGTYYRDGDVILSQTTKDGTKTKDIELYGIFKYGKEDIDDEPMFIAQMYTDNNGEVGFGHFYNGGD